MRMWSSIVVSGFILALSGQVYAQEKKVISSPDAPQAIGPYSQAIRAGKTLYLAGQISIDPKTKQLNTGTIEEQTRLVLENLKAVLAADGLTMDHVVSTSVFLKDLNEFAKMNEVYGTPTWECDNGCQIPKVFGIDDDRGELMVLINWNTDIGDAWEWAENPYYPLRFSTYAFEIGVNMIVYAMSH